MGTIDVNFAGRSFKLYEGSQADLAARDLQKGSYEAPLPILVMATLSRSEGEFLDVGANSGIYSVLASFTRDNIQVRAFEPFPPAIDILEKNITINHLSSRVILYKMALSDKAGMASLYVPNPNHGLLETSCSLEQDFKPTQHSIQVPVVLLDDVPISHKIAVIKADIEGHEPAFLRGASKTVERDRPIIFVEILRNANCSSLSAFVGKNNYLSFRLRQDLAIRDEKIAFDICAWNWALIPAEKIKVFQDSCAAHDIEIVEAMRRTTVNRPSKIASIYDSSRRALKASGVKVYLKKGFRSLSDRVSLFKDSYKNLQVFKDVLFVNGCSLPHPSRYRVDHQVEQLHFNGLACDHVWYQLLKPEMVQRYHCFVFFRCPITPEIEAFVPEAKRLNRRVFFDIDDLMIDKKYTQSIKYLDTLSSDELMLYDSGVERMQKLLRICDGSIASTTRLATELKNYISQVFINRNVASEKMVELSQCALRSKKSNADCVVLGYFSGSITHNDDLRLIEPVLKRILTERVEVRLLFVGLIAVPPQLAKFGDRIIVKPFSNWTNLPELIAEVDINLVPLENSTFNEAKSENKWIEAALVKVATVASGLGPFQELLKNNETAFLCSSLEDWYEVLCNVISNPALRQWVAENAYRKVLESHTTATTGHYLAAYLRSALAPSIAFLLPTTNISGGVNVVLKHAQILRSRGLDVTILFEEKSSPKLLHVFDTVFLALSIKLTGVHAYFDKVVSTLWSTCSWGCSYPKAKSRYYLVQNFETDFYEPGHFFRLQANSTYSGFPNLNYITISKWCQEWLKDRFQQDAKYAPNGIDLSRFNFGARSFDGKIRVLIEGDSGSYYKNVDEAFRIANRLDRDKYETWYLSYGGKPKSWYRYEKFLHQVPYDQVGAVYRACHVLLKTSVLESFSYPPLEMMATGGVVVARPNGGNLEYLRDQENCLLYRADDVEHALSCIERLASDPKLRDRLIGQGRITAEDRSWEIFDTQILGLYDL